MTRYRLFDFEARHEPVLPRRAFVRRLARNTLAAILLICLSLWAGMLGYHLLEGMRWIDAFSPAARARPPVRTVAAVYVNWKPLAL